MVEIRKNIKVFLGSPGDLNEERNAAKVVVDEVNMLFGGRLGYQIELVGWEDTVSIFGRPQEVINRELDRCELFVGLMWKRWGTPPDNSGIHTSGFEEEFHRSMARRQKENKPEISMFFKEVDADLLRDPGAGLSQVIKFKENLIAEKKILFENFSNCAEFEKKLRRCLANYIFNLKNNEKEENISSNQNLNTSLISPNSQDKSTIKSMIGEEMEFLADFLTEKDGKESHPKFDAAAVARLRLLMSAIRTSKNDSDPLGAHDLNLIFMERGRYKFSKMEIFELIFEGLEHYENGNVPVWYWCEQNYHHDLKSIGIFTLIRGQSSRIGAFKVLNFLGIKQISGEKFGEEYYRDIWLSETTAPLVRAEALVYLANWGNQDDISVIIEEINRKNTQTTNQAIIALIKIKQRINNNDSLRAINEYQPSFLSTDLVDLIFENPASLDISALTDAVANQNSQVRILSIKELMVRGQISGEMAQKLIEDPLPGVRFLGLKIVEAQGKIFTDEQLRGILVPPLKSDAGLFTSNQQSEILLEKFKLEKYSSMAIHDLEKILPDISVYDYSPYFAYVARKFPEMGDKLRGSIDQKFLTEFDAYLFHVEKISSGSADLLQKVRNLSDFVRGSLTRGALDIICEKSKSTDLALVRRTLQSNFIRWNSNDTGFFAKWGEWQDIDMLIGAHDKWEYNLDSFETSLTKNSQNHLDIAGAIYAIGKSKFRDVLNVQMPAKIKVALIWQCATSIFSKLSDDVIYNLFDNDDESVRKAAILKILMCLPVRRNRVFFERYMKQGGKKYYNIIHWLDICNALPKDLFAPAVKRYFRSMI